MNLKHDEIDQIVRAVLALGMDMRRDRKTLFTSMIAFMNGLDIADNAVSQVENDVASMLRFPTGSGSRLSTYLRNAAAWARRRDLVDEARTLEHLLRLVDRRAAQLGRSGAAVGPAEPVGEANDELRPSLFTRLDHLSDPEFDTFVQIHLDRGSRRVLAGIESRHDRTLRLIEHHDSPERGLDALADLLHRVFPMERTD